MFRTRLKSLIKYQLVFFVTLIIGYGQLFIPLTRDNTVSKPITDKHYKSQNGTSADCEAVYVEEDREEDDTRLFKKTEPTDYFSFLSYSPWEVITDPTVITISTRDVIHPAEAHIAFRVLRL